MFSTLTCTHQALNDILAGRRIPGYTSAESKRFFRKSVPYSTCPTFSGKLAGSAREVQTRVVPSAVPNVSNMDPPIASFERERGCRTLGLAYFTHAGPALTPDSGVPHKTLTQRPTPEDLVTSTVAMTTLIYIGQCSRVGSQQMGTSAVRYTNQYYNYMICSRKAGSGGAARSERSHAQLSPGPRASLVDNLMASSGRPPPTLTMINLRQNRYWPSASRLARAGGYT